MSVQEWLEKERREERMTGEARTYGLNIVFRVHGQTMAAWPRLFSRQVSQRLASAQAGARQRRDARMDIHGSTSTLGIVMA